MATGGGGTSGIEMDAAFNATETCWLERDTDSGFGGAVVIAKLTGGTQLYTDSLPLNGITYYYRAQVRRTGFTTSSYSSTVSATPVILLA